jgi:glucokinase
MARDKIAAVGVEMQGGKATVALIDQEGWIIYRCPAKTLQGRPALATLEPYLRALDSILAYAQIEEFSVSGIGLSIPGSLDFSSRRPIQVPLLPALNNFPLCDFLEARYHLPISLSSDVDAAVLGEHRFGAGRGFQRLLFLTVNAVVGAAFLCDGQLEQTQPQYTGHISHLPVSTNGPRCSCGKRGCINTLVSIDALQRMVQRALRRGDETSLTRRFQNHEYFSPQLLAEEAGRGDSVALQIYCELGRWLGTALSKYVNLFHPHLLILGGDVVGGNEFLLTTIRSALNAQNTTNLPSDNIALVPSCLGSDAALIGAAAPLIEVPASHYSL